MAKPSQLFAFVRRWVFGQPSDTSVPFSRVLEEELEDIALSRQERGILEPPIIPEPAPLREAAFDRGEHGPKYPDLPGAPERADEAEPPVRALGTNPPEDESASPDDAARHEYSREVRRRAYDMGLYGLAFSGGGIRSATFCLGVIQALSASKKLRVFDYLSTVSGGGYIGSWLTAWIKRSRGGVRDVEETLGKRTFRQRYTPVEFIRDFSNYLAPRLGFFSADTWTIASVWLRNTLLNQIVILLFLAVCMLLPRIIGLALPWLAWPLRVVSQLAPPYTTGFFALAVFVLALSRMGADLRWFGQPVPRPPTRNQAGVVRTAVLFLVAAWLGAAALWHGIESHWTPLYFGLIFGMAVALLGYRSGFRTCFGVVVGPERAHLWWLALIMASLGSAATGIGLSYAVADAFRWMANRGPGAVWHLAVWGGPVILLVMTAVAIVQLGLFGRWIPDDRREWWSRLGAWLFILAFGYIVLASFSIYGPLVVAWLFEWFPRIAQGITTGWVLTTIAGVASGQSGRTGGQPGTAAPRSPNKVLEWVAAVAPFIAIGGMLLALSTFLNVTVSRVACVGRETGVAEYPPAQTKATTEPVQNLQVTGQGSSQDVQVHLAVPIRGSIERKAAARLALDSGGVCFYRPSFFPTWRFLRDQHWVLLTPLHRAVPERGGDGSPWFALLVSLMVAGVTGAFAAWRVDVNEFSMHHFYKNRLVRCYLGASNPRRDGAVNPFTGFALEDDVLLGSLHYDAPIDKNHFRYVGPYPVMNAALNFNGGERLAWQERKAASFVFTPKRCGYDSNMMGAKAVGELSRDAYRPTNEYAYPDPNAPIAGIHVGTAAAISGAAVSPNMGYHTSTPIAFLLTLFNVRLGWWLGNPRHNVKWQRSGPLFGLVYLVKELFGSAKADSDYVYLSDGGHFENLAIYELARRRCRFILCCDAEEDHDFHFGGLGNAVRKCRTDLGIEIDLDLWPLLDRDAFGHTPVHAVVGKIRYPEGGFGVLVYLKSSLVQPRLHVEPADVLEYSMRAKEFPHQTTGDQFFDESQFESYRKLGEHVGSLVIPELEASGLL